MVNVENNQLSENQIEKTGKKREVFAADGKKWEVFAADGSGTVKMGDLHACI